MLKRALRTCWIALDALDLLWIPVIKHWRLNERHYGALQGLDKAETAAKHGEAQVKIWRRSYDTPPPALAPDDPRHPSHDRRYASLTPAERPATESLKDTVARFVPYWLDTIAPAIARGERVLIAAHGNSLRALVKYLDGISDQAIIDLNIPTGIPAGVRARREPQADSELLPGRRGRRRARGRSGREPGEGEIARFGGANVRRFEGWYEVRRLVEGSGWS